MCFVMEAYILVQLKLFCFSLAIVNFFVDACSFSWTFTETSKKHFKLVAIQYYKNKYYETQPGMNVCPLHPELKSSFCIF